MSNKEVLRKVARHPPAAVVNPTTAIAETLLKLREKGVRHALVGDEEGKLIGIVSAKDLLNYLGGGHLYRIVEEKFRGDISEALKAPISTIMKPKPFSIKVTENLADAINLMFSHDIGVLPILEDDKIWGVLSERHIFRLLTDHRAFVTVSEIMSKPVIAVKPETSVLEVMKTCIANDVRRLPIVDRGSLIGILTIKDCVRYLAQSLDKLFRGAYSEVMNVQAQQLASKPVYTIAPDADIIEAVKLMNQHNIGCLPVVEKDQIVGILTERDFLIKLPKIKGVEYIVDTVRNAIVVGRVWF